MFSSKIILILWIASTAYSASLVVNPDEEDKVADEVDNSPFDKILAINQKSAKLSRTGGPNYFEGDIVITDAVKELKKQNLARGGGVSDPRRLWPLKDGKREIPYYIDRSLSGHSSTIKGAMQEWEDKVKCLSFVPYTQQHGRAYLYFTGSGQGCSSPVGYQGRQNKITLGSGCRHHGVIIHEIGHSLGFWHEQSRLDRDQHIQILTKNIKKGMEYNFAKQNGITTKGFPYDTGSIMHYGRYAFSANGQPTIIQQKGSNPIGQRTGLSTGDIDQANAMYCTKGSSSGSNGSGGSTSGCTDNRNDCPLLAKKGLCTWGKYVTWMKTNCKKSCRLC